ncbi:pickpocket protein 28-like [Episyrphus balteatus]|uniref:pickpocket protein 28-like n=1 Tax=Episyrphus balteatus TaxID=286459 RepID=UPI00248676F9|nr:pickpocket protein 28-like [Episyrphus balteatus]
MCRNALQGFKVTLHTPGEEPQVSKKFVDIPFDQTVLLAVKPRLVTTSDGLRHYQPERRQCYYQNERYLRYFKVYNQVNCQLECLANQTLAKCGCVKFSMPRNSSHPVCGADSIKCMDDVIDHSSTMKFKLERNPNQFNNLSSFCHCLPTCIEIEYKAELEHQVAIDVVGTARAFREDRMGDDIWSTRVTQLSINFKADVFNGLKRSELYSWTDFIASCGGLLGLFMGISILSLVEFVYFFTIRLWRKLRQTRRKQRRLSKKKRSLNKDDSSREQSAKI